MFQNITQTVKYNLFFQRFETENNVKLSPRYDNSIILQ